MKTLEQIKEDVAIENGFISWGVLEDGFDKRMLSYAWQDVAKDYAQSVAEDLRERIAESDVLLSNYYRFRFTNTDKDSIRNVEIILP